MQGMLGKQKRLSRLLGSHSGRGFCIAFDHALQLGTCPGVEKPEATLDLMTEAGVDAVILSLGAATRFGSRLSGREAPAIILRLDQTTMWRAGSPLEYPDGHTRLVATVEDAVAFGADAVITYLFVGHRDPALETRAFEDCAAVNAATRRLGIVHIVETMAARGGLVDDVFDPATIAMHTRIGMEMGADVIKTDWPGSSEASRAITRALAVPVLMAGGQSRGSDRAALAFVRDILNGGAAGILFGRNIFQAREPLSVMKACRSIIHDDASIEQAIGSAGFKTPPR